MNIIKSQFSGRNHNFMNEREDTFIGMQKHMYKVMEYMMKGDPVNIILPALIAEITIIVVVAVFTDPLE